MKSISLITIFILLITGCGNDLIIKKDWNIMSVTYYIIDGGKRLKRSIDISDFQKLKEIKDAISIKERRSKWSGVGNDSTIIDSELKQWNVNFVFENRLDISDQLTQKQSYVYVLNNTIAYDLVRLACLGSEKLINSNAELNNIILRTNLSDEYYKPIIKINK